MKGNKQHDPHGSEPESTETRSDDGRGVSVVATAAGDQRTADEAASPGAVDSTGDLPAKVQRLEDSLLRARADLQNAQRRATAERLDAVRYANAELMKSLVQVLDDFERALATAEKAKQMEPFLEGMRLVYQNLTKALADHGLETVDASGKPFDPSMHEALLQQPTTEQPSGTVLEQVTKGYRLRGRMIRPARVIVAKAPDSGGAPEPEIAGGTD